MNWLPPSTLSEKVKRLVVPPALYIRYRYAKELRRGEKEIHLVPFLARRDRVSLDVGANKGVYAYAMLAHSAAVHAFEPNPKLFAMLQRWARGRVQLHPIALSSTSGDADLLVPRTKAGYSNQGASLSSVKVKGAHGTVRVDAVRLDEMNLPPIGFIKIDVEGFELEVLKGAAQTLRRDRPNLLIEIEEAHTAAPLPEMIAEVCAYGYRCLALQRGTLTMFERIDVEAHHRQPRSREDYIFNFIFLPR
jgi:FkbM family methyltransferase